MAPNWWRVYLLSSPNQLPRDSSPISYMLLQLTILDINTAYRISRLHLYTAGCFK